MLSSVDQIYGRVREMTANFEFKPGERLNESTLSKALGASRTPLREAMNRLVAEGLLVSGGGRGFYCHALNPDTVLHLYELREALEVAAVAAAVERATDGDLDALRGFIDDTGPRYVDSSPTRDSVDVDETFHRKIAELARNPELLRMIEQVNERIRYVRWIAMRDKTGLTHGAHLRIFQAIAARDATAAKDLMRAHIRKNNAEAIETVGKAYAQLYVPQSGG